MNLGTDSKVVRWSNAVAAGSTDVESSAIDMLDYDNVMLIAGLGTLTAGQVTALSAEGGPNSDESSVSATWTPTTPAMADGDSNKLLILDIEKPLYRYIFATINRKTQNAVIDFGIAILYNGKAKPAVVDSSVSQLTLVAGAV